eukprot:TRINITY_DN43601_c0_g1_i1.p1 TRINITY_DN43601_c0_g1~~TRINITY_DN43601_c0_g1_i1.p1  ORF type:complete len:492 (+),score=59.30 TRINITY_DN43601_c0_g1_i1:58-1476(+)
MTPKDLSFELEPSDTDGLAVIVRRFQVDELPGTRERFATEPYLRSHLTSSSGWISTRPRWICARLLSISPGQGMTWEKVLEIIQGPMKKLLKELACRDLPVLEFYGTLFRDEECRKAVWKIKSKPAAWIAELRNSVQALAQTLGLWVRGLAEPRDEVHIILRGRHRDSGKLPQPPTDRSDFRVTLHKLGFKRRFELGTGQTEPFGTIVSINFGSSSHVTSGGSVMAEFSSFVLNEREFPQLHLPLRTANGPDISNGSSSARPPIVELHESTTFPLDSDIQVAEAASLQEAALAAAPDNAAAAWAVGQRRSLMFSESVVLLKVTRDPGREYLKLLETCSELQTCREDLEAAGKNCMLRSGAKAFVHPWQYDAAMAAVDMRQGLTPQHVLVSQDLEETVMKVIQRIPCTAKVRVRSRTTVPSGLASEAIRLGIPLGVERTFINIHVPSSLRSSVSAHQVASTTDAHRGRNPRRA